MNVREWALPVYTILMQLAVGALLVLWILRFFVNSKFSPNEMNHIIRNPILVISFTVVVAMIGAHFHLSKPFHSFLAVLNFRSSWLSREIVFTLLFFLTTASVWYLTRFQNNHHKLLTSLGWLAILFGITLVYCMASIYLLPTQVAWNSSLVILSFYTTTLLLGGMTIACLMVLDLKFAEIQKTDDIELRAQVIKYSFAGLTLLTFVLVIVNITVTFVQISLLRQGDITARTSLSLLIDLYLPLFMMRLVFLSYACFSLGYAVYRMYKLKSTPQNMMTPVYLSCLLILVGEIIGRFLFYATHIRVGL
jgi:anaerobic dimethyl sulfoxide reductase subunit C